MRVLAFTHQQESSNALIEGEKRMMTSVDQREPWFRYNIRRVVLTGKVLDDVQGLYATVEQLLKVADNVVSTRSRDLQGATSLLYSNPVRCPSNSLIISHPVEFVATDNPPSRLPRGRFSCAN